jgi:hypothetical protein
MTHKVYNKPLLDKLGVTTDSTVSVVGIRDSEFLAELRKRISVFNSFRLKKNSDLIFYAANSKDELRELKTLSDFINSDGAIWVVSRKGKQANIKDFDVIAAAKAAGLVDNKVVGFSETHRALRLVIPFYSRSSRSVSGVK